MDQLEMMKQMAAEDGAYGELVNTPPPTAGFSRNPELDRLGLELFSPHMTLNAYNTFLSLIHWAILCQKMVKGESLTMDNSTFAAMQAPFVGFGNPELWETTYRSNISQFVHNEFFLWYLNGKRYQIDNPLPHIIVKKIAPVLSNRSKGWSHAKEIADLIADPKTYEKL